METIDGPCFGPSSGKKAKSAIIFLHGYGSDGNDLIQLAPNFSNFFPDTAFYSPNGPYQSINGIGREWFSLNNYDPSMIKHKKYEMNEILSTMYQGAKESGEILNTYINGIVSKLNISYNSLALIGFSQGTMMALHVGLRQSDRLAAILAYSGIILGESDIKETCKSKPPIMMIHGSQDQLIPVEALHHATNILKNNNIIHESHIINELGHGINDEAIKVGIDFLSKYI